jgi:HlyD family secretion protein
MNEVERPLNPEKDTDVAPTIDSSASASKRQKGAASEARHGAGVGPDDQLWNTTAGGLQAQVLRARGPLWRGGIALVALIVGFGVWSTTTQIAGAIIASGQIEIEQKRQVVQHPDGGVVADILIREGDTVEAGEILVRLDGTLLQSELDIVSGQLSETRARRARLEAERDGLRVISLPDHLSQMIDIDPEAAAQVEGQRRLFEARAETLARTLEQLERRKLQTWSQIEGIEARSSAINVQLALIAEEMVDQQSLLDRGLVQSSRLLALQREQAALTGQLGELTAERAQAEGRITEIDLQILGLQAERREEASTQLRDIGSSELELVQRQRALVEQMSRLDIRAPTSGTVLGLQVTTQRSVVRPADEVTYIVPQDRPLLISVQVSPIHIDEIWVGQPVKLIFPGFSSRTTPELEGVLTLVSADALIDPATNATYYRAEISIASEEAELLGHELMPGMPVDAFIQTQQRTPLAYLVKPFTDYFTRAFRET